MFLRDWWKKSDTVGQMKTVQIICRIALLPNCWLGYERDMIQYISKFKTSLHFHAFSALPAYSVHFNDPWPKLGKLFFAQVFAANLAWITKLLEVVVLFPYIASLWALVSGKPLPKIKLQYGTLLKWKDWLELWRVWLELRKNFRTME